jgi:hypothetical protein
MTNLWSHLLDLEESDKSIRDLERMASGGDEDARLKLKRALANSGYGFQQYGHPLYAGILRLITKRRTTQAVSMLSNWTEVSEFVTGYYRPSKVYSPAKVEVRVFKFFPSLIDENPPGPIIQDIRENGALFGVIDISMSKGCLRDAGRRRREWESSSTASARIAGPYYSAYNLRPLPIEHVKDYPHKTTPKAVLDELWRRVTQDCPDVETNEDITESYLDDRVSKLLTKVNTRNVGTGKDLEDLFRLAKRLHKRLVWLHGYNHFTIYNVVTSSEVDGWVFFTDASSLPGADEPIFIITEPSIRYKYTPDKAWSFSEMISSNWNGFELVDE